MNPSTEFMFKDIDDSNELMASRGVAWSLGSMLIARCKPQNRKKVTIPSNNASIISPPASPYLVID
ncbi:hypothetical protein AYI69_g6642, partial [Smittium culicis]